MYTVHWSKLRVKTKTMGKCNYTKVYDKTKEYLQEYDNWKIKNKYIYFMHFKQKI